MDNKKIRDEELRIAKSVDMLYLVRQFGYTPICIGKKYILKEHDSFVIFEKTNTFCHYSQTNKNGSPKGGSPIDFCVEYGNMNIKEAISYLLDLSPGVIREDLSSRTSQANQQAKNTSLVLPEKNDNYKRVFAYLSQTRGIAPEVISFFMHEKRLYESKDYHNCVFVSYDDKGEPKYASQRGTVTGKSFKGDVAGSDKEYGFSVYKHGSDKVIVFEAPIDLMSYMTLYPNNNDSLHALGCLSTRSLSKFLRDHPDIRKISMILDNDLNAPKTCINASNELKNMGYIIEEHELNSQIINTHVKDVNEYLIASRKIQKHKSR